MRKSWMPMKKRVDAAFKADPDISKREAFAKLPFDIAMRSTNEKVILGALEMLRKMHGHDERTVNLNERNLTGDDQIEKWRRELEQSIDKLLPTNQAQIIDGIVTGASSCLPAGAIEKLDSMATPIPEN